MDKICCSNIISQNKKNYYYRFGVKHRRLKPLLPTHFPPPFNSFPNCQFEIGLDACGILELLFNNSELESVDMTSRRNINYSRLAVDEDNTGREATFDPRFDLAPERSDKVPWKAVALALFLLFFGCVLLLLSLFIFTGHMGGDRSQAYGLLGLGTLTFLPGFYETRIAYYSWRGAQGYYFAAIPSY